MAVATVFFSYYVVQGLWRLGVRVTPDQARGIVLTWRYVGHLFGISAEMLCASEDEARRLTDVASCLEFDPDDISVELCKATIEDGPEFIGLKHKTLAPHYVRLLYAMSRKLLGDQLADRLGYPKQKHRFLCLSFIVFLWFSSRFRSLIPRKLERTIGMETWLETSDYTQPTDRAWR